MIIPKSPNVLRLSIGRLWNGERCPDSRLSALVEIQKTETGILIRTILPKLPGARLSESTTGSRLINIDDFDRVCLFFVEEGGQYLEIKISATGQYLVLGFDQPRQVVADFSDIPFVVNHKVSDSGQTINEAVIPLELFPSQLTALNAFLVAGNQTLAYYPVSGSEPDLHQPNLFPLAKIEE